MNSAEIVEALKGTVEGQQDALRMAHGEIERQWNEIKAMRRALWVLVTQCGGLVRLPDAEVDLIPDECKLSWWRDDGCLKIRASK